MKIQISSGKWIDTSTITFTKIWQAFEGRGRYRRPIFEVWIITDDGSTFSADSFAKIEEARDFQEFLERKIKNVD